MSRHFVNKVLRAVELSDDEFARYRKDIGAFVAPFDLTPAERKAFIDEDYAALYALGAHPFLLNAFIMMFAPRGAERAHADAYRESIVPYGYPSFDT